MYITYENLESSEARLREIEIPLRNHLQFGDDNVRTMASTSGYADAKLSNNRTKERMQRIITRGFGEYESLDHHVDQRLKEMEEKLEKATKRYLLVLFYLSAIYLD